MTRRKDTAIEPVPSEAAGDVSAGTAADPEPRLELRSRAADGVEAARDAGDQIRLAVAEEANQLAGDAAAAIDALIGRVRRDPLPYAVAAGATVLVIALLSRGRRVSV